MLSKRICNRVMIHQYKQLDSYLESVGCEGYLIEADSTNSSQYYMTNFEAPDSFISLYKPEGIHLLVAGMEANRAGQESIADTVSRNENFGGEGRIRHFGTNKNSKVLSRFLNEKNIDKLAVPDWLPVGTVDGIRRHGHEVIIDDNNIILDVRSTKTKKEINYIRNTQKINEKSMAIVENMIKKSKVSDEKLYYQDELLTSQRIRSEIEKFLLEESHNHCGFTPVVACGAHAADPHKRGQGPIFSDRTIIVDIFPRSKETRYHGDLSRTFIKGSVTQEIERNYSLVKKAQKEALNTIESGVSAESVHNCVCDVFEKAGIDTVRSNPTLDSGFTHRTGHGVGLDVHEKPRLSSKGGKLKSGMVVTVEPGLYDPDIGGIRIEDLVVVRDNSCENLTDYSRELVPI